MRKYRGGQKKVYSHKYMKKFFILLINFLLYLLLTYFAHPCICKILSTPDIQIKFKFYSK